MKAYYKNEAILNKIRRSFLILLVIGFFVALKSDRLYAQYAGYTRPPSVDIVLDIRSQSLGNSFVSFLGNEGAQEINPASIGSN